MSVERSELGVERSAPHGAVFLSYAREDSAAAQRIADALRAFGIEVWFDREELRGGDAWDARIRTQIKTCALFMPVVSAQTEARGEGYFRREWKLAVDRTHDMGAGRAFLVPVAIDGTKETGADVPEEFLRYQWIRLPDGAPTPQIVEQVKRLLAAPRGANAGRGLPNPPQPPRAEATFAAGSGDSASQKKKAAAPAVLALSLAVVVVSVGVVLFLGLRGGKVDQPGTGVADPGPAAAKPAPTHAAAPASSAPASATPPSASPPAAIAAISDKSIAVLPFANMSAEKDAEFFADGVHEDLLTALAKVRDLKVISRTSVLGYRDTAKRNLRQIASELGVAHILEGSVRRAGNKARITVQLIEARTDQHLWAESYDRDVTDIFAVQGEVAREITGALKASLTPAEESLINRRLTANPQAYDLFVRARALDQNLQVYSSREEYERVTALYTAAAEADPAFVLAHVQIAISHGTLYWFAGLDPTASRRAKALAALENARALAPGAPEVRLAIGSVAYLCNNDWRGALAEFQIAQQQLPNDAQLLYRMALAHRRLGEVAAAEPILQRCVALNPHDVRALTTLLETQVCLRRHPEAVATFERYKHIIGSDGQAAELRHFASFELTRDLAAFLRGLQNAPPRASDPQGLLKSYELAMYRGDLAHADLVLQDPRWETVAGLGGVAVEPTSLHRAQIAFLQGRTADAGRLAGEAIRFFEGRPWTPRQQLFAKMGIARAKSCAGRHDEAVQEARTLLVAQEPFDRFVLSMMRFWAGRIFIAAERPDDALAVWQAFATEPGSVPTPAVWALDPQWQRLRDNPRYAEIFQPVRSF